VPGAGTQSESVAFTPTDSTDYASVASTVSVLVNKATLTVTASSFSQPYGSAVPPLTANIAGFVNGDPASVVSGAPTLSTLATSASLPGSYSITVGLGTLNDIG
jgi:MBG domain (YGX type)